MPQPHEALKSVLLNHTGFETISDEVKPDRVKLFGRVREKHVQAWLAAARNLLLASREGPLTFDISRQYFLRGDKMFFGWRLIIQGEGVLESLGSVSSVVQQTQAPQPAQVEDEIIPLNVRPNRNAMRNGKGVSAAGSVPLAMSTARQRTGGS